MLAILAAILITGDPVQAVLPGGGGDGLCAATAVSSAPATDFPQTTGAFVDGVDAFLEANVGARTTAVAATNLDLTNAMGATAAGDFAIDAPFAIADTTTAYATRLRGYLQVEAVGTIHVGAYADDAVAIVIYDAAGIAYPIIVRPPALGTPAWRSTSSVTFAHTGMYPIEILHVQISASSALEVSTLRSGTFTDFEQPANQVPVTSLATAGFTLLGPAQLFLDPLGALLGAPPATTCTQCDRQVAMTGGTAGCPDGMHCGPSANCEPCSTSMACGPACEPCSGGSEACENVGFGFECMHFADDFPPDFDAMHPIDDVDGGHGATGAAGGGGCCSTGGGPAGALVPLGLVVAIVASRRRS